MYDSPNFFFEFKVIFSSLYAILLTTRLELNQLNSKKGKISLTGQKTFKKWWFQKKNFEMSYDQTEDRLKKKGEATKENQDKSEEDNEEQENGYLHKINLDSIREGI